jgi:hypothetical protein
MIVVASLLDESALPWQPDWYRRKVCDMFGDGYADRFRLWYNDNAMHGGEYDPNRSLRIVSYTGALCQALLDVSDWVERGVVPPETSRYEIVDSQVVIPETAAEREGIQPVVKLTANGGKLAAVKAGETVVFDGVIDAPPEAGAITNAAFDFDGSGDYADAAELHMTRDNGSAARVTAARAFDQPGVYFPSLRAASNRLGDNSDIYTQVKNLDRVRVIVS